jgi:replicative DNA helicase
MQLFTDWANKENKTIIFIHHSTKNSTQSRGASAFVDAVRTVYELDKIRDKEGNEKESHKRIVKLTKDNYGISNILEGFSVQRELFPCTINYEEVSYKENSLKIGTPIDF